jgi:hypothetical protein
MEMQDGIAKVNQERICPNEAISITLDDLKRLDELISRIEANVDVS